MADDPYDVVVVGGGPVGLYAGFRSALLHLRVHIVDTGKKWSRGFHVPQYLNFPTKPDGIAGRDVIDQLRQSLARHPHYASIDDFVTIDTITRPDDRFVLHGRHHPTMTDKTYTSRAVVLATGVVDQQPIIGGSLTTIFPYANQQLLCYCVICDGSLIQGKPAAVIGNGSTAVQTALDVMEFKAQTVTILTHGKPLFPPDKTPMECRRLQQILTSNGIGVVTEKIQGLFGIENQVFGVQLAGGREMTFGIAFSALGFYKINNDLAIMLGGTVNANGYICVDQDCRVLDQQNHPLPGLYAIGDVNHQWNQLMIGFGDADRAILHAWSNYL